MRVCARVCACMCLQGPFIGELWKADDHCLLMSGHYLCSPVGGLSQALKAPNRGGGVRVLTHKLRALVHALQVLTQLCQEAPCHLVAQEVWGGCGSAAAWWGRQRCYTNSLAASSIVGYLLGLGDRCVCVCVCVCVCTSAGVRAWLQEVCWRWQAGHTAVPHAPAFWRPLSISGWQAVGDACLNRRLLAEHSQQNLIHRT